MSYLEIKKTQQQANKSVNCIKIAPWTWQTYTQRAYTNANHKNSNEDTRLDAFFLSTIILIHIIVVLKYTMGKRSAKSKEQTSNFSVEQFTYDLTHLSDERKKNEKSNQTANSFFLFISC